MQFSKLDKHKKITLDKRFFDALIEIHAYAPKLKTLTELKKQLMIVLPSELRSELSNRSRDIEFNSLELSLVKLWFSISGNELILTNDEKI